MTNIRVINGDILVVGGAICVNDDCCCGGEVCNDVVDVEFEFTGVTNTEAEGCPDCEWLDGTFEGTGYNWSGGTPGNENYKEIELYCSAACTDWDAENDDAAILEARAGWASPKKCFYGKVIVENGGVYTKFPITINNGENATECGTVAAPCGTGGSGTVSEL